MNRSKLLPDGLPNSALGRAFSARLALICLSLLAAGSAPAQTLWKPDVPLRSPGGILPLPVITSVQRTTNNQVKVDWTGFAGPYELQWCPSLGTGDSWKSVPTIPTVMNVLTPLDSQQGFFRISGPSPEFAGAETCGQCHSSKYKSWAKTGHGSALELLKNISMDKNPACLQCHTVGAGLPTGFKDETATPAFAHVQCENCHGPGAKHAENPDDLAVRPVNTLSANLCGGCHSDAHHPTYEEWETAGHSKVADHVAEYFRTIGPARIQACGPCHSGSARLSMLLNKSLPTGDEAANTGITCVVCHDPHSATANGSQLRNPTSSLIPFSYSTSTNTNFKAQYNASVSICGQCHNSRGGTWKDGGRPPHHSQQYNMLIGDNGVEDGTTPPQSKHRDESGQCTVCHMFKKTVETPTETTPNVMGHTFSSPSIEACAKCHDDSETRLANTQADTKQRIATVKALLDQWATSRAPDAIRTKYGALAWEYTSPGELSNPSGSATVVGPSSAEQATIPDEVKQARWNLYMVAHDLSNGIHNTKYAQYLLQVATAKINTLLGQ